MHSMTVNKPEISFKIFLDSWSIDVHFLFKKTDLESNKSIDFEMI